MDREAKISVLRSNIWWAKCSKDCAATYSGKTYWAGSESRLGDELVVLVKGGPPPRVPTDREKVNDLYAALAELIRQIQGDDDLDVEQALRALTRAEE